jgi:putative flippase GtrA
MLVSMDTTRNTTRKAPGPVDAFARFVVLGGGVGLASSATLILLAGRIPFAAANALVTIASTLLATELHSRFTFGGDKPDRADHVKAGLTVLVCYLFTTAAMLTLHTLRPHAGVPVEQSVYLCACGLAGIGRFAFMRLVVFGRRPEADADPRIPARASVAVTARTSALSGGIQPVTKQNSFPAGSSMVRNAPWSSVIVVPTAVAPSATAVSTAAVMSSTSMSRCSRFLTILSSGTGWKAMRTDPNASTCDHPRSRSTGSPPSNTAQNRTNDRGSRQSTTTCFTRARTPRAYGDRPKPRRGGRTQAGRKPIRPGSTIG